MDFIDGSLMKNSEGTELYCKYWKPDIEGKPRALVFIAHGFGEHCSLYDNVAKALTEKGCFVFAHDHVGHGRSAGPRVMVSSFNVYVHDVLQHVDKVKEAFSDVPIFIVGHSMGGLIAVHCGLERANDFKGMALIAPALAISPESVTSLQMILIKRFHCSGVGYLTERVLFGGRRPPVPVKDINVKYRILASSCMGGIFGRVFRCVEVGRMDSKLMCRDEEVVKRYEADPLVWHGGIKAGQALQVQLAMEDLDSRMDEVTWAQLIQHGTADGLAPISGSRNLNDMSASYDKTLSIMQNAYHMLHAEPKGIGERCVNEVVSWIQRRI